MPSPLSVDLRERVVVAVAQGASCHRAAARFGVSVSSASRWSERFRQEGLHLGEPGTGRVTPGGRYLMPTSCLREAHRIGAALLPRDLRLGALTVPLGAGQRGGCGRYGGISPFGEPAAQSVGGAVCRRDARLQVGLGADGIG